MFVARALLLTLLVAAPLGCAKKPRTAAAGSGSAAVTGVPKLAASDVRALLYRCEARAQADDVKGFRDCLTRASERRLDQQFASVQKRLSQAALVVDPIARRANALAPDQRAKVAKQLLALSMLRLRLSTMMRRVSWKAHLAKIAKAPRSEVIALEQKDRHAKFKKRFKAGGKVNETWHTLAYERGAWRVDLVGNPEFAKRIVALEKAVRSGVTALQARAAALGTALAGAESKSKSKSKVKAKAKTKGKGG
ncbi:MAG: hypothetical protein KC503_23495 [Myxococcales bacterium]|nr:hypothetical protein [Myxococcales bacterium]